MSYLNAAIIVADQVQEEEFFPMYYRLMEDFNLEVVYVGRGKYNTKLGKYGIPIPTTMSIESIKDPNEFAQKHDIFYIPGGIVNAELLRMSEEAVILTQQFMKLNKLVCSICHGPQLLITSNVLKERVCGGYPAIASDIKNAGAIYSDASVTVDKYLITSPHYKDNSVFMKTVMKTYFDRFVPEHYQG